VYETHAIAGGVAVSEDTSQGKKLELISRNVMRIEIPANARTSLVHKSDAQGIKRKLIDVHVATPNGISNHLLVEVQPKDDSKSTASPTQNTATKSLAISYVLLRKTDANANANSPGFVPVFLGVAPANAEIDLTWPAAGAVPATVDASINFPIPGGAPDLAITSKGLTHQPVGGIFPLAGAPLNTFAADLLDQAGRLDLLNPQKPATQLTSNKITLTPPAGAGTAQDASASGPIVINFTSVQPVAHVTPAALSVKLVSPIAPDPSKPSDVTIDWLGAATKVQANVTFDFTTTLNGVVTPIGTLSFTDGVGGNIQLKGGMRVIPEAVFLAQLNTLVTPLVAASKLKGRPVVINARTITILPQLDGIALAPILVTSPFEVDLAQVQSRDGLRQSSTKLAGGVAAPAGATSFDTRPAAGIIPPVKRRSYVDNQIVRANANVLEQSGRRPVSPSGTLPRLPLPRPFRTAGPGAPNSIKSEPAARIGSDQ
jgi:hypothetical protein